MDRLFLSNTLLLYYMQLSIMKVLFHYYISYGSSLLIGLYAIVFL